VAGQVPNLSDLHAESGHNMTDHRIDRPAEEGELCTCGRPALVVVSGGTLGYIGWCGQMDSNRTGPCPFCGGPRHQSHCPSYRLRPSG
jgi:hypothetical protein